MTHFTRLKLTFLFLLMLIATFCEAQSSYAGNGFAVVSPSPTTMIQPLGMNEVGVFCCPYSPTPIQITVFDSDQYGIYYGNNLQKTFTNATEIPFSANTTIKKISTGVTLTDIRFLIKSSRIVDKIQIENSNQILKNDTLFFCEKEETPYITIGVYDSNIAGFHCSINLENNLFDRYVNGKQVWNNSLKDGDKFQVVARKQTLFQVHNSNCWDCLDLMGDSVASQIVTVKHIKNEVLPKPLILSTKFCAGDTVRLVREAGLKNVEWRYLNTGGGLNYGDTARYSNKLLTTTSVYLKSQTKRANGCYAVSDTFMVKRTDCGFKLARGKIFEQDGINNSKNKKPYANKRVRFNVTDGNSKILQSAFTYTDEQGNYRFELESVTKKNRYFQIAIADEEYYVSSGVSYSSDSSYHEVNLITYKLLNNDLSASLSSGRNRPGFDIPLYFNVSNPGKNKGIGSVELTLDNDYTFLSSTPSPKSITGNTLTWQLDTLKPGDAKYFSLTARLDKTVPLGDTISSTLKLVPQTADENSSNNSSTLKAIVTGSFDPNDLAVNPVGNGTPAYISDSTMLDYTIRFQNMGTDTAFTIVVAGSLSQYLDFGTFKMLEASHPYTVKLSHDTIYWTFKNILLPDNKINEPMSHGMLHYKIKQKKGNPLGAKIGAEAGIYFDFNPAVLTNKVFNTIGDEPVITSISDLRKENEAIEIYPNPTDGKFTIETKENSILKVYNFQGALVYQIEVSSKAEVDLSKFARGVYYYMAAGKHYLSSGKVVLK